MENKALVTRLLFDVVKECRAFDNLVNIKYRKEENGDEAVLLSFKYGNRVEDLSVNVTADSCAALIQDVWKKLYEFV